MDLLCTQDHTYSLDCGSVPNRKHFFHKHPGMGLCTCLLCKPSYLNIPGLWCTLVCTRCKGLPANQEDTHKQLRYFAPCILHLYHKARDCMGQWFQVLGEELQFILLIENHEMGGELTCDSLTLWKWISRIALIANTDGYMVPNTTVCVHTTETWAGILAFTVNTGSVRRAVRIDIALRSAVRWRTYHLGLTTAFTAIANNSGKIWIGPTRVGITGINFFNYRLNG